MTKISEIWHLSPDRAHEVYNLYKQTWWAEARTLEQTKKVLEGSDVSLGLYSGGKLIAFARAVTDFICKAIIYDVVVDEHLRGTNLGKVIMNKIVDSKELSDVEHVELYCLPEMEDFYNKIGYEKLQPNVSLIRLKK